MEDEVLILFLDKSISSSSKLMSTKIRHMLHMLGLGLLGLGNVIIIK